LPLQDHITALGEVIRAGKYCVREYNLGQRLQHQDWLKPKEPSLVQTRDCGGIGFVFWLGFARMIGVGK
jgi:hypothetical protein